MWQTSQPIAQQNACRATHDVAVPALPGANLGFFGLQQQGMSVLGQKRGFDRAQSSSGLPRRTDIIRPPRQVRLVPEVGLIYLMPRWQGFLNVVLTIPCTAL